MALLLRLLPIILIILWLYWIFTAGKRTVNSLQESSKLLYDQHLNNILKDFENTLEIQGLSVRLLPWPIINAVAATKAEVYITQGLYDAYLQGDVKHTDMAAILAHELGHVALGHSERRIDQMRIETTGLLLTSGFLGRLMLGWLGFIVVFILKIFRSAMSRRDEFEADAFAAMLLARAGYDPEALIEAMYRVQALSPDTGQTLVPSWLRSHPSNAEREAAIRKVTASF